jgi:hypothetical protein
MANMAKVEDLTRKYLSDLRDAGLTATDVEFTPVGKSEAELAKAEQADRYERLADQASEPEMRREYKARARALRGEVSG